MQNIKNSLKNLWKNKGTSLINVIGLTVALSSVVFIYSWVISEVSFDKHNENYKEIYMLASELSEEYHDIMLSIIYTVCQTHLV